MSNIRIKKGEIGAGCSQHHACTSHLHTSTPLSDGLRNENTRGERSPV